jgi:hypothetical protein
MAALGRLVRLVTRRGDAVKLVQDLEAAHSDHLGHALGRTELVRGVRAVVRQDVQLLVGRLLSKVAVFGTGQGDDLKKSMSKLQCWTLLNGRAGT